MNVTTHIVRPATPASTIYVNKDSGKEYAAVITDRAVKLTRVEDRRVFNVTKEVFLQKYAIKGTEDLGLIQPDPERDKFENLVLSDECVHGIRVGAHRVLNRDQMEQVWHISKVDPHPRTVLNFFGASGTGKTRAAMAIARELSMPVLKVDYAGMVSSLHGQTGKQIKKAFKAAKDANAILLLDEADSLVSKRISMHADRLSMAVCVNLERNVFMQELDSFNGVVILTTNFFNNYDEAILRRIAQHVEFKMPNAEMREKLFKLHIPNMARVGEVDWKTVVVASKGLSGGDIFQVVVNAINDASLDPNPDNWRLTQDHLMAEVKRLFSAKLASKTKARVNTIPLLPSPPADLPALPVVES
jgi:SpoVK/Ycf46/Vps4 family AAA+-type ATPase